MFVLGARLQFAPALRFHGVHSAETPEEAGYAGVVPDEAGPELTGCKSDAAGHQRIAIEPLWCG